MSIRLAMALVLITTLKAQPASERVKRASALIAKHDYPAAISELRQALVQQPGDQEAHALLGQALLAQGYSAEAIPHLEQAQKLDLQGIA